MSYTAAITLGLGLSMDAFAAALGQGAMPSAAPRLPHAFMVGMAFGIAQGLMPLIGWGLGYAFKEVFELVDHWIAFVLLVVLGIRMMIASRKQSLDELPPVVTGWHLGALAIATSIDAAVAGITLAMLDVPVPIACMIIAAITFLLSTGGVLIGRAVGSRMGSIAEFAGGLILIVLGTKILIEHQFLA